tara:strand:- start:2709 stop:3068 length:360 start_codon:yes stop_codon:yes gene_type:complete
MIKIKSITSIVLLFSFSFNVYSDVKIPTIKEYTNDTSGFYDSYIYGVESGLEWAAEHYYRKYEIELYCKPRNIKLPVAKLREMINNVIQSKPSFFKKYDNEPLVGLALRNGYIQKFPCQ